MYVVDAFTLHAASGTFSIIIVVWAGVQFIRSCAHSVLVLIALAAVTCFRSVAGFGFPLFAPAMYAKLGYGKGDTVLACFAVGFGCPA